MAEQLGMSAKELWAGVRSHIQRLQRHMPDHQRSVSPVDELSNAAITAMIAHTRELESYRPSESALSKDSSTPTESKISRDEYWTSSGTSLDYWPARQST
jgi:hypothetical protein